MQRMSLADRHSNILSFNSVGRRTKRVFICAAVVEKGRKSTEGVSGQILVVSLAVEDAKPLLLQHERMSVYH